MHTLTGQETRTITGYVVTLLEYPRWIIEREVDFTDCHLGGDLDMNDRKCASCHFGDACCWLNLNRTAPSLNSPLQELIQALGTAVSYLRSSRGDESKHAQDCDCDTCRWLHEAMRFLRTQRHRS